MNRTLLIFPILFFLFSVDFSTLPVYSIESSMAQDLLLYPCDSIPELNRKIIDLVDQQIGKTVGRGECWDLAAFVLNQNGAKWDKKFTFGRKIDPKRECVYPGDIMQFEGVKVKYTRGLTVYTETMDHHTAVIHEVKAKGVFVLAHQNTGTSGRKVGFSDLDLKTIVKGKYLIYRPVM